MAPAPWELIQVVRTLALWGCLAGAMGACASPGAHPQTSVAAGGASPRYHVVHGWPQLPASDLLGGVSGVAVDSHDHVVVFRRADRAWTSDELSITPINASTVLFFDGADGTLRQAWGAQTFAMPHGLRLDRSDNVWLTDVALHQVFKYSHDGKRLLVLGERGVPGSDAAHFNRPTDVAVLDDGSFYVADGYRNTRVMKFAADGRFLFQWGTPGNGPGQFDTPHSIAVDATGRVHVADRGNARVQVFTPDGQFLAQWRSELLGRPYALALGPDGRWFVADGGDQPDNPPDRSALVVATSAGEVLERIGRWGNYDGQFAIAHDVAVARDGSVYVGDIVGMRVQKFVPGPPPGR